MSKLDADIKAALNEIKFLTSSGTYRGPALGDLFEAATDEDRRLTINLQLDSYQLLLTDDGQMVDMAKGTANDLIVPLNVTVPFPIGTQIVIRQVGAGQTTIVAALGVTLQSKDGLKISGQYGMATIIKVAMDTWAVTGALTA